MIRRSAVVLLALPLAACGPIALGGTEASHDPSTFEALPEVTVCVVDRAAPSGLRDISGRRAHDGRTVLLVEGAVVPLDSVHRTGVVAGYAAAEPWFASDSVTIDRTTFVKVQGERRIDRAQVTRIGDFQGIPVFGGASDEPPHEAVYLPTRPGCVFQAYIRRDLM